MITITTLPSIASSNAWAWRRANAALQIQALFRGHIARKRFLERMLHLCAVVMSKRRSAALHIQASWRHHRFCLDQLKKALRVDSAVKIQAAWRAKSLRLAFDAARRWSGILEGCPFARLSISSRQRLTENLDLIFEGFPGLRYNHRYKNMPNPPREAACNWGVNLYEEVMERHDLAEEEDWMEDDFEPVQVYPPHQDDHVAVKRSVPRVDGQVAFDVTYADGPNKGYWQRAPITLFMDFDDLTFSHQAVADAVNDWVQTASEFPKARRNCICCNMRAEKGKILCRGCIPKYQAIIDAE